MPLRRSGCGVRVGARPKWRIFRSFQMDHAIARQHAGLTTSENLALACFRCNTSKGLNLSGIDPRSGRIARLFNPRHDDWIANFRWLGPKLVGLTATGRATIVVLRINHPGAVLLRTTLQAEGVSFG